MTPIRYPFLLLLCGWLWNLQTTLAQCDIQLSMQVTQVLCAGENSGALNITASNGTGSYTYLWSNGQTTEDLNNLVAGAYTCTVTDDLACTATTSAVVNEPAGLVASFSNNPYILNCVTPSVNIVPSVIGGVQPYTYLWSNGGTTAFLQTQQAGTYTVTITDANTCSTTASTSLLLDFNTPVACAGPAMTLTCSVSQFALNGSCSSSGPNFTYTWFTPDGNLLSGANTINPIVNAPGTYTLLVTNTINGCTSTASVVVTEDITLPLCYAGPNLELPCGGDTVTLNASSSGPNVNYLWAGPGINSGNFNLLQPTVDLPGIYSLTVTNLLNGCTSTDIMVVSSGGSGLCSDIRGRVILDESINCQNDPGEPGLSNWIVKAEGQFGDYYGVTDGNGDYQIYVEPGDTYSVAAVPLSNLWLPCAPIPGVVVTNVNETLLAEDLLFQTLAGCPLLTVDISSGNLRRCFGNNFFSVSYCNIGTEPAVDAYVIVTLDPFFTPWVSSIPYNNLGNGQFQFDLGDVAVGECGSFNFHASLSCDAVFGQTHCTEAHIYPDSACIQTSAQWSGASLRILSECDPDSVRFRIENVGFGNMPSALEYIVVEDQVMLMMAPVQLNAGQSTTISVPANGSTWRLEVAQEPFHPGYSAPAVSVEGCTTGPTFSTGFVNQFSQDDADEFIDIHCLANTGSYDPNDKQGFPLGYGEQHYIRPGTALEYLIRFQNTGNDTAFTVRIVDTLSGWLDPASFRAGASSHPYSWNLSGAGVLTFLFENILLPDSNVNEPASHGFIKFTLQHRPEAPLETLVKNTAHIYFDFNDPIVTNTTEHRLGENFITVGLWQPEQPEYEIIVAPNPFSEEASITLKGLSIQTRLELQLFDFQGKLQMKLDAAAGVFHLKRAHLTKGVYGFRITQAGKVIGTGKLVLVE